MLLPVLALVLDPGSLEGGGVLTRAYEGLGFASQRTFALAVCAAVVGVIVYTALTWPVNPDRQKPAESYQQMKQTAEDLGVLAPPEDVLPWTQSEYDFWLDNTWRFARPCGYTMAGDISYEGTVYSA